MRPEWSAAAADRAARDAAAAAVQPPVTVPRPDAGADAGQPLVPATRSGTAAWQAESGQRDWSCSSWGAADDAWGDEQAMLRKAREVLEATEAWYDQRPEGEGSCEHEEVLEPGDDSGAYDYVSEDQAQGRCSPAAEAGGDLEPGSRSHGEGGRDESQGSGEGGSTDPQADLCGAYTLSGRCAKRACNLVHGAVCPVRGNVRTLPSRRLSCHAARRQAWSSCSRARVLTPFHVPLLNQSRHKGCI